MEHRVTRVYAEGALEVTEVDGSSAGVEVAEDRLSHLLSGDALLLSPVQGKSRLETRTRREREREGERAALLVLFSFSFFVSFSLSLNASRWSGEA